MDSSTVFLAGAAALATLGLLLIWLGVSYSRQRAKRRYLDNLNWTNDRRGRA